MTKISPEFEEIMQTETVLPVSVDVSFASHQFPKYKLGANNQILEEQKEDKKGPSLREVVEQETAQLSEQHKQLSVRDLASKFDKNLAAAAKLSDEAKIREVASLEGHVLLKKLRDALEVMRGKLVGHNKDDVDKAISMVEALAVQLTQKEGELIQGKFEVKKLTNFLKQATEDAKKLVSQEKSFACAEIESAKAVVWRIGEVLEEQERNSPTSPKQDVEELVKEVQEARRIKLLHQPSKVVDMEYELHALRTQIREKSLFSSKLQKELATSKWAKDKKSCLFILVGSETLGSCLQIQPCSDKVSHLSECTIQWYRISSVGSQQEHIQGANKAVYAPEPFDVGSILQADIVSNGRKITLMTAGPIDPAAGLGSYVETLLRKSNAEFNVFISQTNGQDNSSHSTHVFHVGKMRMKLCKGWLTKARENYSSSMQLCGVRDDNTASARSLFWLVKKGLSFVLTFASERDRNAAIILSRKYAFDCNVTSALPLLLGKFHTFIELQTLVFPMTGCARWTG